MAVTAGATGRSATPAGAVVARGQPEGEPPV